MDLMMVAVIKLQKSVSAKHSSLSKVIHGDEIGLETKVQSQGSKINVAVYQIKENTDRIEEIEELATNIHDDIRYLQSVIQKQDRQIANLKNKVVDLTAHSM